MTRQSPLQMFSRTPRYVLTGGLLVLFVAPLAWAAYASVAPQGGTSQTDGFGFGNYLALGEFGAGLPVYVTNSVIVSLLTVLLTAVVSVLAGYGFARFRFPGRNALFLVILGILMVPSASLLIPLYVLLGWLQLNNTLFGLALVLTMYQLPFSVFMMRVSFEAIPAELEEAALVDGTSTLGALRHVLLPAVVPGIVTICLYAFLAAWNDFIAPLILVSDDDLLTLPVAIANLRSQTMGAVDYGATEAGVIVLAIPCIVLFLVLQRYYIRGFMSGALKG